MKKYGNIVKDTHLNYIGSNSLWGFERFIKQSIHGYIIFYLFSLFSMSSSILIALSLFHDISGVTFEEFCIPAGSKRWSLIEGGHIPTLALQSYEFRIRVNTHHYQIKDYLKDL